MSWFVHFIIGWNCCLWCCEKNVNQIFVFYLLVRLIRVMWFIIIVGGIVMSKFDTDICNFWISSPIYSYICIIYNLNAVCTSFVYLSLWFRFCKVLELDFFLLLRIKTNLLKIFSRKRDKCDVWKHFDKKPDFFFFNFN